MKYTKNAVEQLEQRFRANLINGLSGYKSANLIGTVNSERQTNLAIVSSVVHLGANPPLVAIVFRPPTVPRHSYDNIINQQYFTINQVSDEFWQQAHQTSARYDGNECEFKAVGLTPQFTDEFKAPYVGESKIKYGVKLVEVMPIKHNGTQLVIGEIVEILLPEDIVGDDGYLDISKVNTVAISGLDTYHLPSKLGRLSYAKPDCKPKQIDVELPE